MKEKKLTRHCLILILLITNLIYIGWRLTSTLPLNSGYVSIFFGLLLFVAEFTGFLENAIFYFIMWNPHQEVTPEIEASVEWPSVDIFIATYNEPVSLLYKTINACKYLNYPDHSKVHIYVCDDGHRASIKALADELQVGYIDRDNNLHAKAGNLNHAMEVTHSYLIVTLDADMIVQRDFLIKTVPFFIQDEKMGFVQTPQSFYNPDTFQYNLFMEDETPNEQDLFYTLVQSGRSKYNAVIYAGSNTVLSRRALSETGGFETGTITEDIATGMKLQVAGYHSVYLNETLASGLAPLSIKDMFNQRIRWAIGIVQTMRNHNPLKEKFSWMQRILYTSSLSYWFFSFRRIIYISSPLLFVLLNIQILDAKLDQVLWFWLPMFVVNHFTFKYFSKGIRSDIWSNIYETIFAPALALALLKEIFGFKLNVFKVTPKEGEARSKFVRSRQFLRFHYVLYVLSILAILKLVYLFYHQVDMMGYSVNIFWIIFNLYILGLAVLYAHERPLFRDSVRFKLSLPITIQFENTPLNLVSYDVSEGGLSVLTSIVTPFKTDQVYEAQLSSLPYVAHFKIQLIRTSHTNTQYVYAFKVVEIDTNNMKEYLQIIYDRIPPLPTHHQSQNPIKHILKIVKGQFNLFRPQLRTSIRLSIEQNKNFLVHQEMVAYYCLDFNFEILTIKREGLSVDPRLTVVLEDMSMIHFTLDQALTTRKQSMNPDVLYYKLESYHHSQVQGMIKYFEQTSFYAEQLSQRYTSKN